MNDHVGRLWAQSYPMLGNDPGAIATCRVIVKIVEVRAKSYVAHGSWREKIQRALKEFGIPERQWEEFNESILARQLDSSRRQ